jgi:hypothetical protein
MTIDIGRRPEQRDRPIYRSSNSGSCHAIEKAFKAVWDDQQRIEFAPATPNVPFQKNRSEGALETNGEHALAIGVCGPYAIRPFAPICHNERELQELLAVGWYQLDDMSVPIASWTSPLLFSGVSSGLTKAEIGGLRCGSPKISEAESLFA